MKHLLTVVCLFAAVCTTASARQAAPQPQAKPNIIAQVRAAIAKKDFAEGERILGQYRAANGDTPDALEAMSWLGRGALAERALDRADAYARETYRLSVAALDKRELDAEPRVPIALGAAIEVQAHVLAQRGRLSEAVYFLNREIETYGRTSIRTRIQKNINLLTLEGKPAPALRAREHLGAKPAALGDLKGKAVILFFWAHWCPDCKAQAPILEKLQQAYAGKGLVILAPTQRFGYVAGRKSALPEEETRYIEEVRQKFYGAIDMGITISDEDYTAWGVSTTPTLVLVDRRGIVRLYHPGQMTMEELDPKVRLLLESATD
ncbi:MAG: redoxin domain-containing protein [Acidobacteria bacterium]|nr:redoxin domain-containing protein [Acidobacteriota bacterium]